MNEKKMTQNNTPSPLFTPEQEEAIRQIVYEYVHSSLRVYVNGVEQMTAEEYQRTNGVDQTPPQLPVQSPETESH